MVDADLMRQQAVARSFEISERYRRQGIARHSDAVRQARWSFGNTLAQGGERRFDRLIGRVVRWLHRNHAV